MSEEAAQNMPRKVEQLGLMFEILAESLRSKDPVTLDAHRQLDSFTQFFVDNPTNEVVLTYCYGQVMLLLCFYVLWEQAYHGDERIKEGLAGLKQRIEAYYDKCKKQRFLMKWPLLENLRNITCLLDTLPESTEFFKTCIGIFGMAIPLVVNSSLAWRYVLKIGDTLFK